MQTRPLTQGGKAPCRCRVYRQRLRASVAGRRAVPPIVAGLGVGIALSVIPCSSTAVLAFARAACGSDSPAPVWEGHPMHVPVLLVIDDEPPILSCFRVAFAGPDVKLLTAPSAAEGLRLFFEHHPDVVIL